MSDHKNIAVIPARGGSKRLPRKNVLSFLGKPMIQYSVEAASESGLFRRIIVSTDDPEIMDLASGMTCDVFERKKSLATDTARVVDVLDDLVRDLSTQGMHYDNLCCLYATSPLRTREDIVGSYNLMIENDADFCQSVTDFDASPFFAFNIDADGFMERRWPELAALPPWEKPDVVVDNGSIYWAREAAFLETGELQGDNTVGFRMPRWRSVDIDTETDLKLAEFFAGEMGRRE